MGLSFLTNFTWSKELNDFAPIGGSPYLTNSCSCGRWFDYGPSDDDRSKTFKINGEYLVPRVGLPRLLDKIVNGWETFRDRDLGNWNSILHLQWRGQFFERHVG